MSARSRFHLPRLRLQRRIATGGQRQQGMALIVVLWTLVLVSLLAAQVLGRTTQDIRNARSLVDRSAAELAADGGVRLAIAGILGRGEDRFEGEGPAIFSIGGARVALSIEEEVDRVDLNAASPDLLEALLLALAVPAPEARRSAAMILEFRTATPGAREDEQRFDFPPDLARVPGLSATVRQLLTPYVTTFTGKAPREATRLVAVRRALDMLDARGGDSSNQGSWTSFALAFGTREGELQPQQRIVRITAAAIGAHGARFTRTAVVAIQPARTEDYRVLWWQRSWSGT